MKKSILFILVLNLLTFFYAITSWDKEFYAENTNDSLIQAVSHYIGTDTVPPIEPEFVASTTVGKQIVVIFQDSHYENFMGATIFQKGLNGLYRPIDMEYGTDSAIRHISTRSLFTAPKAHTVFYTTSLKEKGYSLEILDHSMFNLTGDFTEKNVTRIEISQTPFIYVYPKASFRDFRVLDDNNTVLPNPQTTKNFMSFDSHETKTLIYDLPFTLGTLGLLLFIFVPLYFLSKGIKEKKIKHSG